MIGVHVIGPGFGESVVIELPGGEVGVIDSFAARHCTPPVLEFIHSNFPKVKTLKFVAVTHPHADHCMGMSYYIEEFGIEEIWVFQSFAQTACGAYFEAMMKAGSQDRVEKALDLPAGTMWLEMLRIKDAIKKKGHGVAKRHLVWERNFKICNGQVSVNFLTPGEAAIWKYNELLGDSVGSLLSDGPAVDPDWELRGPSHNDASGAILLEYGQTCIFLMADAEENLWAELVKSRAGNPLQKVQFIKGSHHGSKNGYYMDIYNWVCDKDTIFVITPFNRHSHPLPNRGGIEFVRPHTGTILCTNSVAATKSTGVPWPTLTPGVVISMPPEWAVDCRNNPRLLMLLADQQAKNPYVAGSIAIPRRWVRDCHKDSRLLQLLCLEARNEKILGARFYVNDEFRVSVHYDEHGNKLKEYLGWGVGQLQ